MPVTINGTTGVIGPDGSASTPSYQGSDSNTGMFFPAADTIAFSTAGTEDMRIDSSGNVGIGTSSPGSITELKAATPVLTLNQTTGNSNQGVSFQVNGTAYGQILNNAVSGVMDIRNGLSGGAGYVITLSTDGSERARIDSSGNLLINTTSAFDSTTRLNIQAPVGGNGGVIRTGTNGNFGLFFQNTSGTNVGGIVINSGGTAYNTTSDYRLKEDVQPMTGALAKVAALKPVTYKWKIDGSDGQGFIAHELQSVVPDCVTGEKDAVDADGNPKYQGIDTSFLVATLTAAIQELTARVQALESKA